MTILRFFQKRAPDVIHLQYKPYMPLNTKKKGEMRRWIFCDIVKNISINFIFVIKRQWNLNN